MSTPADSDGIQTVSEAFFTLDGSWRFTYFNDYAKQFWGRDSLELVGRVMWEEFPSLDQSPFGEAYRKSANERVSVCLTAKSPSDNRWFELRVFPMGDGLTAHFHDVTEKRLNEERLQHSAKAGERERRMFETALGNTPDHHYVLDLSRRFSFASAALLKTWDVSKDEIVGKSLFELSYPPEVAKKLDAQLQHVIESGATLRDEAEYSSPEGTHAYEYIFVPVFDADGKVEAVAGSSRNITAHKASEQALRDEAKRKDEFLATLAHELRNPLAPIRNALEVARMSNGNTELIATAFGIMERQLGNMVRLIDDLLELSRLNLNKVEMREQSVDLALVVTSAIETARPHITQGEHDLRLHIPADVVLVRADAARLSQVFANLLTNAAKFTPPHGHITLTVAREGLNAMVRVRDDGVGIDASLLGRVFDMFTQAPGSIERAQGGLGIGLALVKGIVQLHGGAVEVKSEGAGKGTEFTVRLPLQLQPGEAEVGTVEDHAVSSVTPQHILVVDDNVDSAASLAMMLRMLGHETATANDGLQALAIAEWFLPDVCLMDIGMPNLNGIELAKRMRAEPWAERVLLVALTGWGQEEDKRRSLEAGIDFHLVKPVSPTALVALLERFAGAKSGGQTR